MNLEQRVQQLELEVRALRAQVGTVGMSFGLPRLEPWWTHNPTAETESPASTPAPSPSLATTPNWLAEALKRHAQFAAQAAKSAEPPVTEEEEALFDLMRRRCELQSKTTDEALDEIMFMALSGRRPTKGLEKEMD